MLVKERDATISELTCIGTDSKRDAKVPVMDLAVDEEGARKTFRDVATVDHLTFTIESGKSLLKKSPLKSGFNFLIGIRITAITLPNSL